MKYRELTEDEIAQALELTWTVFQKFEAPEYSNKGVETFHQCLQDSDFIGRLRFYGAFDEKDIVGMLATRNAGSHIALFFVDEKYQKKGIGKKLFELACRNNMTGVLTVNSSPYAVNVYHHLGFDDTNTEQTEDGIRYTPMICHLDKKDEAGTKKQ